MNATKSRNPWPIAIIAYFIVFIAFIVSFTAFASRQKMDLVQHDYYDDEVRYQQQLDRLNRTQRLTAQAAIAYDASSHAVTVKLPSAHVGREATGQIRFYRPSDANLDLDVPLSVNSEGIQNVDTKTLRAGRWKVRVYWKVEGQEYFEDKALVLAK
jgi:hypothetical protein